MTTEATLYTLLTSDGTVGGLVSTRVYPWPAPENATPPFITYRLFDTQWDATVSGNSDSYRELVEINCHATTYAGARTLRDAVESALNTNGYPTGAEPYYDSNTKLHTFSIDWSYRPY